jgi:MFS transporter, CP family, cyanate transporter
VLWITAARRTLLAHAPLSQATRAQLSRGAIWRRWRAWELILFFGVGTGAYTLLLAWPPPFGWRHVQAGYPLADATIAEVVAGLGVSAAIDRVPDRSKPLLIALGPARQWSYLPAGGAARSRTPRMHIPRSGIGALFPLSLIVALDHSNDPVRAGELVAFAQGGGYLIASLMPLVAGALRDRFADLSNAWAIMLVGSLLLCLLCTRFSPRTGARLPHIQP